MRGYALLGALLILPGCLTEGQLPVSEPEPVPDIRPDLIPLRILTPLLLGKMDGGAEPNIAVDDNDTIYVTTPLALWRSTDGAKSFQPIGEPQCGVGQFGLTPPVAVCPAGYGHSNPGLEGGGDGDIAIDEKGQIHWAGLGNGVPYQRSSNQGERWSNAKNIASAANNMDREWIDAENMSVYANWRDLNAGQVIFRMSEDGGQKWKKEVEVAPDALAGPVVHDPISEMLYIPMVPFGSNEVEIARSSDGKEWEVETVASNIPDHTAGDQVFAFKTTIFPVAAVDEAGTVYVIWSTAAPSLAKQTGVPSVYLAVSKDQGRSWTEPLMVSSEGRAAIFPWIAAGKPGRVAIVWYENRYGMPNDGAPDLWDVKLVESVTADGEQPKFEGAVLNEQPIHVGYICTDGLFCTLTGRDRSLLDFFEVAIRPNGQPIVTWSADDELRQNSIRVYVGGLADGAPLR